LSKKVKIGVPHIPLEEYFKIPQNLRSYFVVWQVEQTILLLLGVMDSYCWIHSTFSVSDSFKGKPEEQRIRRRTVERYSERQRESEKKKKWPGR
jgi:hypothetical protein